MAEIRNSAMNVGFGRYRLTFRGPQEVSLHGNSYTMNFSSGRPAASRLPSLTCQGKLASTEVHEANFSHG